MGSPSGRRPASLGPLLLEDVHLECAYTARVDVVKWREDWGASALEVLLVVRGLAQRLAGCSVRSTLLPPWFMSLFVSV
jgi:hypothetical protein